MFILVIKKDLSCQFPFEKADSAFQEAEMNRFFSSRFLWGIVCFCAGIILTVIIMKTHLIEQWNQPGKAAKETLLNQRGHFPQKLDEFEKKFFDNSKERDKLFDDFFSKDFFKTFNDPFKEMEIFRKKIS